MFLFGSKLTKITNLTKFIIKALTKAIKAGNKIISLYEDASDEVATLKNIVEKLETVKTQIENATTEVEDNEELDTELED